MDDGFVILEMVGDDSGRPIDFTFTDTNLAFEEQSGLQDVLGKRVSELIPEARPDWVEQCAEVLRSGVTLRLENEIGPKRRLFDVIVTRIGGPGSKCVGVVFRNVTERIRNAQALKRTEERYR